MKNNMIIPGATAPGMTTASAGGVSRRKLLLAAGAGLGCLAFSDPLLANPLLTSSVPSAPLAPVRGGVLRAAFTGNAGSPLNVLNATQSPLSYVRARLIWDSLAELDQGQIRYRLMTSAQPNNDASRWHITLREGVTFSDGRPLTSRDVLHSLHTFSVNPTVQNAMLSVVDFAASKTDGDHALTLALNQPVGAFDLRLATAMFIFPAEGEQYGSGGWLADSCNATYCQLKPRADYWDASEAPQLDAIQLYGIDDMNARINGLKGGQFDYIASVPLVYAISERHNPAIKVHIADKAEWGDLAFIANISKPPFNQPEVTEALKLSVDRQAMVKTITYGMGEVANDLFGSGQPWFDGQLPARPYDPDKARALLKRAGVDSVRERIRTSAYEWGMVESSTLLMRQAKPAGFVLSVNKIPVADYYADMPALINAPLKSIKFDTTTPLPVMLPIFHGSKARFSFSGITSPQLDQLLAVLQRAQGDAITAAVHDVQHYLYQHSGDVVFARIPSIALSVPQLHGVRSGGTFNYPQLRAAWFGR